jgi:uncharacterized tellurite resistance protein B-like protein
MLNECRAWPLGMAAVIPEFVLIVRNQLKMIYDIGILPGQSESLLTKEVLIGVMISASGTASAGILTIHGGKVLVKRTSLINLMKTDGAIHETEEVSVRSFMKNTVLPRNTQQRILRGLRSQRMSAVDYRHIKKDYAKSLVLMVDLVTYAKVDGYLHPKKEKYIKQVGKMLDISDDDLFWLLS